ncbi:MAG: DUF2520 domain-containing protein [Elusimicrobiales bacterium]
MKILIIGKSKVAKSFSAYLRYRRINHKVIAYRKINSYAEKIKDYKTIFFISKDSEIDKFYRRFKKRIYPNAKLFHFSGSILHHKIVGMHPIFSFKEKPIAPFDFEKIIFTSEDPSYIRKNLKWFKNRIIKIKPEQRVMYHALLSIYLNFPLIIKEITHRLLIKYGIPSKYLNYVFERNIKDALNSKKGITGPIARDDLKTIKKHLSALKKTEFLQLYKAILNLWRGYENR